MFEREHGVIVACDVDDLEKLKELVEKTYGIEGIVGYKIGANLALQYGLKNIMEEIDFQLPVIYDHQKAGTDIPDMGKKFMDICKRAGVDAVILFPQSGPETEKAWIESALEKDLGVIVGGLMTHPKYARSEGGYLADEAIIEMYLNAAELGVTDFVVPGNRPNDIRRIRGTLEQKGVSPTFYAPGFVAQGGEISDAARVAGDSWHAIVGRGIYNREDIKQAALEYTSKL